MLQTKMFTNVEGKTWTTSEGGLKSSSLAYNLGETRDKRLLGRNPDRSRCYLHTILKLFWLQPMAPKTLCCCSLHGSMGYDQESFTGVWRWHQHLFDSLSIGRLSRVSRRLSRKHLRPPSRNVMWPLIRLVLTYCVALKYLNDLGVFLMRFS